MIVAAAPADEPFNLYEFASTNRRLRKRQLTRRDRRRDLAGRLPDGTTIVFVGYTTDGFDLFACRIHPPASDSGHGIGRSDPRKGKRRSPPT